MCPNRSTPSALGFASRGWRATCSPTWSALPPRRGLPFGRVRGGVDEALNSEAAFSAPVHIIRRWHQALTLVAVRFPSLALDGE